MLILKYSMITSIWGNPNILLLLLLSISTINCNDNINNLDGATYKQRVDDMKKSGLFRQACNFVGINPKQPYGRVQTGQRLDELRRLMRNEIYLIQNVFDAYIVTSTDEHLNTVVSEHDRRLGFISGFSGSYGEAIIINRTAALWTDGTFTLQADEELDCNWRLMREAYVNHTTKLEWLNEQFPNGARIGVNPKLISQSKWEEYTREWGAKNHTLLALDDQIEDLIDRIWVEDRPVQRHKDVFVLDNKFAGKDWTVKVRELRQLVREKDADAIVLTAMDEIAWLLNIRGRDVPYSPLVRSYLIVEQHEIQFFVNHSQLINNNIFRYLNQTKGNSKTSKFTVRIYKHDDICNHLRDLTQVLKIIVPSASGLSPGASHYIHECVPREKRVSCPSPVIFLKARKNEREIEGMRKAHIRDAAAMCEFFAYFEKKFKSGENFTEISLVKLLNEIRYEQYYSLGNSFRTIVAYGAHGAKPRYNPTPKTNSIISNDNLLVLDSGGQYYDGTTDVTRTVHLGVPTSDHKRAYTRVLIGLLQLTELTFLSNMKVSAADLIVRAPLWADGMDYSHHTAHGIGSFLNAHESISNLNEQILIFDFLGPIVMNYNLFGDHLMDSELKPGYFIAVEPGYYSFGDFGVRLENVLEVYEKKWLKHSSGHAYYGFRTVTLIPYEPKLIDLTLLTTNHRKLLNKQNEQIREYVGEELKKQNMMDAFHWMMDKTINIPEFGVGNRLKAQIAIIIHSLLMIYLLY